MIATEKKHSLFKAFSFSLVWQLVIKAVYVFFIDRLIQNIVGPQAYGEYFSIFQASSIFIILSDAGINNYIINYKAGKPINSDVLGRFIQIKLLLSILYCVVFVIFYSSFGFKNFWLLMLVMILQLGASWHLFYRGLFRIRMMYFADGLVSLLDKLLLVILFGFLLWYQHYKPDIYFFVICQCLAIWAVVLYLVFYFYVNTGNATPPFVEEDNVNIKEIAEKMWPYGLLLLFMGALNRQDAFMLKTLLPDGVVQTGYYAAGYRLLDAANIIGFIAATIIYSYAAHNKQNLSRITSQVNKMGVFLFAIAVVSAIIFYIGAEQIQHLLYPGSPNQVVFVLKYVFICLPAMYLVHVYGSVLSGAGFIKSFLIISIITWLVNFIGNYIFIPKYGLKSIVFVGILSQYIYALLCMFIYIRQIKNNSEPITNA
jgi:O-antigen/teichoic acid export membrane protein